MTIQQVGKQYQISADTLRYYEKAGVLPAVARSAGGQRDYGDEDLKWVQLAVCLRNAGVSVEAVAEYRRLFEMGDETIPDRLALLQREYEALQVKKEQMQAAMDRLAVKIAHYERALETGILDWSEKVEVKNGQN